jgi:hypothetical protein
MTSNKRRIVLLLSDDSHWIETAVSILYSPITRCDIVTSSRATSFCIVVQRARVLQLLATRLAA